MKGIDLINATIGHLGEPYILGSLVPKDDATYQGPWDCAEFFAWAVYQVSQRLYGCANDSGNPHTADAYTGFLNRDAQVLGKIIAIEDAIATPGAALLRVAGNGLVGHVVLCQGNGTSVEAHSHKDGVTSLPLVGRRWDFGLLVPWIEYERGKPIPHIGPSVPIYRFTSPLMKGPEVLLIQKTLNMNFGFKISLDGVYGMETFNAVKGFQSRHDLNPDGEVGPKTFEALGIRI